MRLYERDFPEGMEPTCECSARALGRCYPYRGEGRDHCAVCRDVVQWVPAPVRPPTEPGPGQLALI